MAKISHSPFQSVIFLIFNYLNKEQVSYAVLRNYETLPEKPPSGNDIDILISGRAKMAYLGALTKAVNDAGWAILREIQRFNYSCHFIYKKGSFWPLFQIDTFIPYMWRGFIWIDTDFLLNKRIWNNRGFYILPPGGEAAILFLKELLANLQVKEKYRARIQKLIEQDSTTFIRSLSPYFGEELAHEMLNICIQGEWDIAFLKRRLWKQRLIMKAFQQKPLQQLFRCANFLFGHIHDRIHTRKGIFVAIIGPDGVGKTTVCQDLQNAMRGLFRRKIHYCHGRFGFLPELKSYYRWLPIRKYSLNKNPSKESSETKIRSLHTLLHLLYYGFEYFIAWPWVLLAKKRGHMLLFDRYFYNFCTQPSYRRFPRSLIAILFKIIPCPDIAIVLKANPEQVLQRKAELHPEEIREQLHSIQQKWLSKITQVAIINTEKPIDDVLKDVKATIIRFLSNKDIQ